MRKGSCHRNCFKTMVTKYQSTKSRAVGIYNEVFTVPESKNCRNCCTVCIQKKKRKEENAPIRTEGPPVQV